MGSAWSGAQLDPSALARRARHSYATGVATGGQTKARRRSQREKVVLSWTLGTPTSEQPCEVGVAPLTSNRTIR